MILRPYQERAVCELRAAYSAGHKAPICVQPTGSGKTVVASEVARLSLQKGNRVGFLVPRIELLKQAVQKLASAGITDVRVIQAQNDNGPQDAQVFVGSIPTLTSERWQGQLPPADLLIIDEAHHSKARTHEELLLRYPKAKRLGLSATPQRGDGRGLIDLFDALVVGATVRELIDLQALVPAKVYAPSRIMNTRELAQDPVDAYETRTCGTKAIVFCATVEAACALSARFNERGHTSKWLCGESKDREEIVSQFSQDEFRVLVNVNCLVEGFDDPAIETAILARRFTHVGSYLQAIGRILRPHPGKREATVIDLSGSALVHGTPDLEREYSLSGKGISNKRDTIRQCQQCGAVFKQADDCPYCDFKLPPLTRAEAKVLGIKLQEVTAASKKTSWPMRAKRHGFCAGCMKAIVPGAWILYSSTEKKGMHVSCAPRLSKKEAA